jgi:plastocyanin
MFRASRWILILLLASICLAQPAQPARKAVTIKDMAFNPASVQVKVGDTVVWTNNDDRDHTVISRNGAFKSDNIKPGGSFSFHFTKAGTFPYGCTYHPRMAGTVVVSDK